MTINPPLAGMVVETVFQFNSLLGGISFQPTHRAGMVVETSRIVPFLLEIQASFNPPTVPGWLLKP